VTWVIKGEREKEAAKPSSGESSCDGNDGEARRRGVARMEESRELMMIVPSSSSSSPTSYPNLPPNDYYIYNKSLPEGLWWPWEGPWVVGLVV